MRLLPDSNPSLLKRARLGAQLLEVWAAITRKSGLTLGVTALPLLLGRLHIENPHLAVGWKCDAFQCLAVECKHNAADEGFICLPSEFVPVLELVSALLE